MKVRTGFVSNSSSSSFVCEVCGEEASGWDMCLSDADMVSCENDHTFCKSHIIGDLDEDDDDYDSYAIPAKHCPICAMDVLTDDDHLRYLVVITNKNHDTVLAEIKQRFANYDEFCNFLRGK
jgi:zona occludens toxin (predicted ATPase)